MSICLLLEQSGQRGAVTPTPSVLQLKCEVCRYCKSTQYECMSFKLQEGTSLSTFLEKADILSSSAMVR